MVKRIADSIYENLSPVEQACVHHLMMRSNYTLPDGTHLPFAESGVVAIQTATTINLFSSDSALGYELLKQRYDDAPIIYKGMQELLACTIDGSVKPAQLEQQEIVRKASQIINPATLVGELWKTGKVEVVGPRSYPKLKVQSSVVAISDAYRLLEGDKLSKILAPYL